MIEIRSGEVAALILRHNLEYPGPHTNLAIAGCICTLGGLVIKRPPARDGETCSDCGSMMIRTGTCHTCTGFGATGGCG